MKSYQETMDEILRREVEEGRVPGASAMVLHRGKEIYFGAFGMADKEQGYPMKRDTIIRLFSMTKPITAVAVMILAQRGQIDLLDPVAKYLPVFWGQTVWQEGGDPVPVRRQTRILDLLTMTSGLPYMEQEYETGRRMGELFGRLIWRREQGEIVTTQDYVEEIAKIPLCFQPGERWMYGLSADVLGAVIEVVSGMRFGEFLKKEIFEPLEMVDTGFYVPREKRDRFAQIYLWNQKLGAVAPSYDCHLGVYYGEDVAFESGGAGLVSTLEDYSHFASMMVSGGVYKGRRILGSRTIDFMRRDALTREQKAGCTWDSMIGYGYGCLMRTLLDPAAEGVNGNPGTFGWDGWTGNFVVMDPVDETVYLYFIQRGDVGGLQAVRKMRMVTGAYLDDLE